MLTLDYIEKNTLWYAKFETGYRTSGTYDEVKKYYSHEDIDEIDTCSWEHQPKELQEFYKSYYYALYDLNRHDLYEIKDFYEEWSKNPSQFKPGHKPVIGKLSEYIESLKLTDDLIIRNYSFFTAGNHRVGNFMETLKMLDIDFDVISFEEIRSYDPDRKQFEIIIQTDDKDLFKEFDIKANEVAMSHSLCGGDGKYENIEE